MRYLKAELELQELLKNFIFDWESSRLKPQAAEPTHQEPTYEQAIAMVERCRQFLLHAHAIVRNETQQWAAEFQTILRDMGEVSKQPEQPRKPPIPSPPAPDG